MKFAIITFCTLALILGVQSSIIPWGNVLTQVAGGPLSYTAIASPVAAGLPLTHAVIGHPPAAVSVAVHSALPAAVHTAFPAAVPAVLAGGHVVVPAGHASYVAKTRGSVHSAPLAGHLNSVANVNLAPAPGTH